MRGVPGKPPLILDSVTRLGPDARGAVVAAASHCGVYAAYLAAAAHVRAVVLNDAGIGRERAGVGGLDYLDRLGLPACAVSHRTARIGHGADTLARGVVSEANEAAAALGVRPGQRAEDAVAALLARAPPDRHGTAVAMTEARTVQQRAGPDGPALLLLDSNSLVEPGDGGAVLICGSHGGLLGGRPETACKVDVFAALYNDADWGLDGAGVTRLPALDARGIAAGTVSAWSARIGDGRSTLEDGWVSCLNRRARDLGAKVGMAARDWAALMRQRAAEAAEPALKQEAG